MLVAAAAATVLGLLTSAQIYFGRVRANEPVTFWQSLASNLPGWYFWAVLTPLILWLGRRFPLTSRRLATSLPVHLVVGVALSIPYTLLTAWLSFVMWSPPADARSFSSFIPMLLLGSRVSVGLVLYFAILGAGIALESWQRASRLSAQLAEAQVRALQMQLHPHFLFNTLHAIRVLVREDPEAAERTLTLLGDLLRQTLAGADRQTVPLRQELGFLGLYLDIERTRFSDRLHIRYDVAPDALDLPVPNLILQPLVENAIRHGVARRSDPGSIEVSGRRDNGTLELCIRNDGPPLGPAEREGMGIGLSTTRERLAKLYGTAGSFALEDAPGGGVVARVRIPVHDG